MKNEKILKFAKVFEIDTNQVLITKEFDENDDTYLLKQTTEFDEVTPAMSMGFDTEEKRDKAFEDYNEENAQMFLNVINSML